MIVYRGGRSSSLYCRSGSRSARPLRLAMAAIPKMNRTPSWSQRSRCLVWVKSVSPRNVILRNPARRQRAAALSR